MARSRRGTLATKRRIRACDSRCHAICTAARSSATVLGIGFIPLMKRDMLDQMFSIMLMSGLLAGHSRTSMAAAVKKSVLIRAVSGVAPSCMKIALSASAWLSIWGSTWGLRTSSTYFWAVRPPWMSTKSILQSLATHPHTFTDIRPDARLGAMLSSWYRSPRRRHTLNCRFSWSDWTNTRRSSGHVSTSEVCTSFYRDTIPIWSEI